MSQLDPERDQEPITRGEYERRHRRLQQKYETFARRTLRILVVMVAAVLLTAGTSAYLLRENVKRADENSGFSASLRDTIVEGCEDSGNPLRAAVRKFGHALSEQLRDDIVQSESFEESGTYQKLFPNIAPAELHAILADENADNQGTVDEIELAVDEIGHVDCDAKYPKP